MVALLVQEGYRVRVLDDLSTGSPENLEGLDVELSVGSVADPETVREASDGAERVVHLAAARAVGLSIDDPIGSDRVNTGGTVNVLTSARDAGVERVVFGSSSSVYGGTAPLPTPESAPLNPRSPYAVSKMAGEHYCRVFSELFGIETVVLRLFNVFGPRQRPDSPYAAAIPLFIEAILRGESPTVFGDGRQTRDFTFVEDVAAAIVKSLEAAVDRHAVLNIAAGGRHSVIEVLDTLSSITGVRVSPRFAPERPGDVRDSWADTSQAAATLDWKPTHTFEEGLSATVDWVRSYLRL